MMRTDGLAQSLEGIKAIGSLAGGAVVLYVVYTFATVFVDGASPPGGYGGAQSKIWLNTGLDTVLPTAFVLLVFFGLVASAVLSRGF